MSDCYEHIPILYEVGKRKSFKLLWLPVLARNEVVRSMDIKDIIKLSLSSRKIEEMIRYSQVKVKSFELHVNINNSILKVESLKGSLYECGPDNQKKESKNLGPQILSQLWIDKNSTSFKNCVSIFKHLQNIISFKSLHLHVNFEGMTVGFFKEILTEPALKAFESLRIDKGAINAEYLDLVMETVHSNKSLYILDTKIPENYYHENAFKFYDSYYFEAEWVRLEHLLSLNDRYAVRLLRHRLTYSDVNTFIKFWIDNDHDMVRTVKLYMSVTFQPEILFDGIIVLKGERRRYPAYLVAANPTKQRKHQIMGVVWYKQILHLCSWAKDQKMLAGNCTVEPWEPEYKVLMVLNKKKELEEELEKIQDLLETNPDQNMVEKKSDI